MLLSVTGDRFVFTFESGAVESMKVRLLNEYARTIDNRARRLAFAAPSAADELAKFIKPHCPWANGKVERLNRTLARE